MGTSTTSRVGTTSNGTLPAAAPVVLWNLALMEATKANEAITLVNCIVDYIYV